VAIGSTSAQVLRVQQSHRVSTALRYYSFYILSQYLHLCEHVQLFLFLLLMKAPLVDRFFFPSREDIDCSRVAHSKPFRRKIYTPRSSHKSSSQLNFPRQTTQIPTASYRTNSLPIFYSQISLPAPPPTSPNAHAPSTDTLSLAVIDPLHLPASSAAS
jgi:hypothetical protein